MTNTHVLRCKAITYTVFAHRQYANASCRVVIAITDNKTCEI